MTSKGKSGKMPSESTVIELEKKYKQYMQDGYSSIKFDDELKSDALLIDDSQIDKWDWEERDFVDFDGTWVYYILARKTVGISIPVKFQFDEDKNWEFQDFEDYNPDPDDEDFADLQTCPKCGARRVRRISPNELICDFCNTKHRQ
jgi:hypothetical protein